MSTPLTPSPDTAHDAARTEIARLHAAYMQALWQLAATVTGMLPAMADAGLNRQATILALHIDDINKAMSSVHDYAKTHASEIGLPQSVPAGPVN